jgi:hypothetical protein
VQVIEAQVSFHKLLLKVNLVVSAVIVLLNVLLLNIVLLIEDKFQELIVYYAAKVKLLSMVDVNLSFQFNVERINSIMVVTVFAFKAISSLIQLVIKHAEQTLTFLTNNVNAYLDILFP